MDSVYQTDSDVERNFGYGFDDPTIRKRFVVKVYSLLGIQLLITIVIIAICIFVPPVRAFLRKDIIVMITTLIAATIFYITLVCCQCARLRVPLNYILLTFMTLFYGVGLGAMSSHYSTFIVLAAMGVTGAIVLILTLIAALPCFDITGWGIYLCVVGLCVSLFGSIALFIGLYLQIKIIFLVYSIVIAILLSIYLVYDTQLILGGRKYQISAEQYILGTVSLYVDIIYIFMSMLHIMQ